MTISKYWGVGGVILAGGKSLRMGEPKPFLKLNDEYFINRIYGTLSSVFESVIIVDADPTERYQYLTKRVYADVYKECGPLAGIHSAFIHTDTDLLFFASCDIPLITSTLVTRVLEAYSGCDAVIPRASDRIHPLCAIYHRHCLPKIDAYLKSGGRSINGFLKQIDPKFVEIEKDDVLGLSNINTPEQYRLVNQQRLGSRSRGLELTSRATFFWQC